MEQQKSVLTNERIEEFFRLFCQDESNIELSETGRPVYSLMFFGTKEEAEVIRQKLLELEQPNQD